MKTFYEHWQDKDKIRYIIVMSCIPNSKPVIQNSCREPEFSSLNTNYYDCDFLLSRENGNGGYVYWVVAIKDGKELLRWNTSYILEIVWLNE